MVKADNEETNNLNAGLFIKDKVKDNTPDYEAFDTIYISIKATDKDQTIGINSVTGKF